MGHISCGVETGPFHSIMKLDIGEKNPMFVADTQILCVYINDKPHSANLKGSVREKWKGV